MYTQLDLCSGVGAGFALAGYRLGYQLVGLSEINEFCSNILNLRYPRVPNYGDVKSLAEKVSFRDNSLFVVTASPPCQPFSQQGKRLGASDPRDCFPAILRAIALLRPRYFCIENVKGLLSCPYSPNYESGSYFGNLMWELFQCGYDAEWQTISSGSFGSPWIRERLILVGISNSIKFLKQPESWTDQIRSRTKAVRCDLKKRGFEPGIFRKWLEHSLWLDKSTKQQIDISIPSGNSVSRHRRIALGGALDPLVAAVGLRRILYLDSISYNRIV